MSNAAKLMREHPSLLPKNSPVPNRRVLVIDDEPEIGESIRRFLSPAAGDASTVRPRSSRSRPTPPPPSLSPAAAQPTEFEVVVVRTPEQAIDAVTDGLRHGRPFAMGFFDVMLGADIDGIELVKQILSVDPRLFAVFVTAYQDRSVDTIGAYLGEENREKWDYINKPFTEGEIVQKARTTTSLWDLHRLKEWQEERLSEANRLLLQNERQNTVAAVGRSVAHEFGNLLTHIIGNAEIALENGGGPAMKNALDVILKAADTAADILLRFRQLHGSAEAPAATAPVDLKQALEEALELLEFQFRKHHIQVFRSGDDKAEISGRRHSLVQVFVNLFVNSIYAMSDGGSLHVRTRVLDTGVEIHIRDSGPGIPPEILPRVTEPLFTTKGKDGSGLGLSICKEIIEIEHGGEFRVQNHSKGGVEIIIVLPGSEE